MSFQKIAAKVLTMARAFDVARDSANGAAKASKDAAEEIQRFSNDQIELLNDLAEQFANGFSLNMRREVEMFLAVLKEYLRLADGSNPGQFAHLQDLLDQFNTMFRRFGGEAGKNFDWRSFTPNTRGAKEPAKKNVPPRGDGSGGNKSPVKTGLPPGPTVISMPNSSGGTSTGNIP